LRVQTEGVGIDLNDRRSRSVRVLEGMSWRNAAPDGIGGADSEEIESSGSVVNNGGGAWNEAAYLRHGRTADVGQQQAGTGVGLVMLQQSTPRIDPRNDGHQPTGIEEEEAIRRSDCLGDGVEGNSATLVQVNHRWCLLEVRL
jgi:hypothetical protein